jgi:hypothetical protein
MANMPYGVNWTTKRVARLTRRRRLRAVLLALQPDHRDAQDDREQHNGGHDAVGRNGFDGMKRSTVERVGQLDSGAKKVAPLRRERQRTAWRPDNNHGPEHRPDADPEAFRLGRVQRPQARDVEIVT